MLDAKNWLMLEVPDVLSLSGDLHLFAIVARQGNRRLKDVVWCPLSLSRTILRSESMSGPKARRIPRNNQREHRYVFP